MKKLTAILLVTIFAFNMFGYRFVVDYMQHKSDIRLVTQIDNNNYDQSQLIELKLPVHLPYQTSWASYERYDGEIEISGKLYKYVERKLSNDTLYLKCLPNTQKTNLETARNDFFKNTNDLSQNNSKKSGNSKTVVSKNIASDYDDYNNGYQLFAGGNAMHSFAAYMHLNLTSSPHISPAQPPDVQLG
ncbi:MAG: hypothetical protein ABIN25_03750 [Ginsengibacter sp.]